MAPGGTSGVVSARGSQISLPEVPGPPAPEATVMAVVSGPGVPPFDSVYRAHAKTVSRWASRLLGPGGDCEDVVQEVFIVVRHKLPRFDGRAEVTTWLYEITVRVVQDWRRRRRWWSWVTGRGPSPGRGRTRMPAPLPGDGGPDPVTRLEMRERVLACYRILDGLAEASRTTFILFELEGLSGERIAEITGTRLGTVWVRLTRARRTFVERMRQLEREERERERQAGRQQKKARP
jgi:RNA polymerase sigma-70 factor (ECF subfamily)